MHLALYRLLLRLYPKAFRRRFGGDMELTFDERWHAASGSWARTALALRTALDMLGSGIAERLGPTVHEHQSDHNQARPGMGAFIEQLAQDVRIALRSLRRAPGFTMVAVLTLSVGIGSSTAIFSVVQGVLLQPLPYSEPDDLVFVRASLSARNVHNWPIAPRILLDMREQSTLLEEVGGLFTAAGTFVSEGAEPSRIQYAGVTPNLFTVLGARPMLGRDFTEDDAAPINQELGPAEAPPSVIILSHRLWQQRFAGDAGVLGRSVMFLGTPHEVIGVMAPGFQILTPPDSRYVRDVDAWTAPRIGLVNGDRRSAAFEVIARLGPGTSLAQARSQLEGLQGFLRETNEALRGAEYSLRVVGMHEDINAEVRPVVLALFGAVGFVLLIACANVSNLLLVRASSRSGELAIRAALGGSRSRVLRQLFTESVLLALLGVIPGVVLAVAGLKGLLALGPPEFPRMESIGVDLTVLLFTVGISLAAAVVFGMVPSLQASRSDVGGILHDRSRTRGLAGRGLLRNGVLVAEAALSLVLLIGAGLMMRSFVALQQSDPGFEPDGLLTFELQLQGDEYGQDERIAFGDELRQRLSGLPGVEAVSAGIALPLLGETQTGRYGTRDALEDDALYGQADYRYVHLDYFTTMGTRLLDGRTFEPNDFAGDGAAVVVVDELVAGRLWPGRSAVGETLVIRRGDDPEEVQIVGVVEHQRSFSPAFDSQETVFFNARNVGDPRTMQWAVRTSLDPAGLAGAVRAAVGELDPQLPVANLQPMSMAVDQVMGPTRFALVLIAVFAAAALALAAVGLSSVLAYTVRQRTAEIGLRMALGAEGASVQRLIMWQGVGPTLLGVGLGIGVAAWLTRSLSPLLIGVTPTDLPTFLAAAGMFTGLAMAATLIPARRATSIDPLESLRSE